MTAASGWIFGSRRRACPLGPSPGAWGGAPCGAVAWRNAPRRQLPNSQPCCALRRTPFVGTTAAPLCLGACARARAHAPPRAPLSRPRASSFVSQCPAQVVTRARVRASPLTLSFPVVPSILLGACAEQGRQANACGARGPENAHTHNLEPRRDTARARARAPARLCRERDLAQPLDHAAADEAGDDEPVGGWGGPRTV